MIYKVLIALFFFSFFIRQSFAADLNEVYRGYLKSFENEEKMDVDYQEQRDSLELIISEYKKVGALFGEASGYAAIGLLEAINGDFDNSTKHLLIAKTMYSRLNTPYYVLKVDYLIAMNMWFGYDKDRAYEKFAEVANQSLLAGVEEFESRAYMGMARVHTMNLEFDSAYFYLNKMDKIVRGEPDSLLLIGEMYLQKGHIRNKQCRFETAIEQYSLSYNYASRADKPDFTIITQICLGGAYSRNGNYNQADSVFNEAEKAANELKVNYYLMEVYEKKGQNFDRMGEVELAEDYYQLYKNIDDSISSFTSEVGMSEVLSEYEILQLENENLIRENEIRELELIQVQESYSRLIWRISLSLITVICLILVFFLMKNLKKKKLLLQQKDKIALYEKEILLNQITHKELVAKQLSQDIELKEGKLTNFAMELSTMNEFSRKVLVKLRELIENDAKDQGIRELTLFLKNHLNKGYDQTGIEPELDNVNEAFFIRIKKKNIKFSPTERSILGLIRLGMSSKEIAELKNIQVNSVEIYRHRIRKKLKLERTDNLVSYLQSI